MILMAADYVGLQIVKWLVSIQESIDVLIYDTADHGGTKDDILNEVKKQKGKIEIYSSDELKKASLKEHLSKQNHEFGVLGWWPYILKKDEIQITKRGFVNTHPAFLPFNRGKHPYFWSIVEGTKFGVSIHWITENIDDGAIVGQKEIKVDWLDTGESLYKKARELMVELFKDVYFQIKNDEICPIVQNEKECTFHYGKELEPFCQLKLDNYYTAREIINILRGRMFNQKGMANFVDHDGRKYYLSIEIREEK